jgi:hypothetical protein
MPSRARPSARWLQPDEAASLLLLLILTHS